MFANLALATLMVGLTVASARGPWGIVGVAGAASNTRTCLCAL